MCHSSLLEEEQIKKFIECGMPLTVLKSIKKQRIAEDKKTRVQNVAYNNLRTDNGNLADFQIDLTPKQDVPLSAANNEIYWSLSKVKLTTTSNHQISDLNYYSTKELDKKTMIHKDDNLTKVTYFIKACASYLKYFADHIQNRKLYKLFSATTQSAHALAILALFLVLFAVWPQRTRSAKWILKASSLTEANESYVYDHREHNQNIIPLIIYLGAFATHFGAQMWMTFVSGIALYFSLPRHIFGQCQRILFPKYFTLNAILSIIMIILYIKYFLITWSMIKCVQLCAIALIGTIEIILRLYITPTLLHLMVEKYKMEDSVGSGKEIGSLVQGDLIRCPHYQRIHKAFRRYHITIAIGNISTLVASCLHLYYLATIICIAV